MPKPDDVGVGVAVFILNEKGQVLLGKRKGAHRAGHWSCPGGWMERGDNSSTDTVIRESQEEVGLTVYRAEQFLWTTEDHAEIGIRTITLYHIVYPENWDGEPEVMEPEKCDGWGWFDLDRLPQPVFPGILEAAQRLFKDLGGLGYWDE